MLTKAALAAALMILACGLAHAETMVCTVASANETLDSIRDKSGEVPILKMTIAGDVSAILVANPKGDFILLGLTPDGRACVFAIGGGMKVAGPNDRFPAEVEN